MAYPRGKSKSEESKRKASESMRKAWETRERRSPELKGVCRIDGCEKTVTAKSLCRKHYMREWRHGDPEVVLRVKGICSFEGCSAACFGNGLCQLHYMRSRRHGDPSIVAKLSRAPTAEGFMWCSRCQDLRPIEAFTPSGSSYCRLCLRARAQIRKYGIAVIDTDICAICGGDRNLVVDHCHDTGDVRGILCHKCNLGIGHLGDNADLLLTAYKYLTSRMSDDA